MDGGRGRGGLPLMTIACAEGGRRGEDRWTKGGREGGREEV